MITNKTANRALILFDIMAVGGLWFLLHEHVGILSDINRGAETVTLDTGMYFLLLLTIFPIIRTVQAMSLLIRLETIQRYANFLFIGCFILSMVFGYFFPVHMQSKLAKKGYLRCGTKDTHRISRGAGEIYRLGGCGNEPDARN